MRDENEIVFVGVSGHVDISGNSAADWAAEDALYGDVSDKHIFLFFSFFSVDNAGRSLSLIWNLIWSITSLNSGKMIGVAISQANSTRSVQI